jgi:class 3 adenylate cyclase
VICPGCGHGIGPRARFCEVCGAPVPEAAGGAPAGSDPGSRARVYAALPALIAYLQREGRVSYRALELIFNGDRVFLDAAREELTFRRLARDEDGQGLVWTGEPMPAVGPISDPVRAQPALAPPAEPLPAALAPAPQDVDQAERRQLTVMFCDLADSTVLAGRLDAEDLREVIRSYQATAAAVVDRYGGHIAQYLGDGLLVYLGWPEAHEDDASRAVHAGLEIAEAIATTLNPRLTSDKGVRLSVRVGIHTGPVVVGAMGGDGRRENLATGETVNIAARLEGLAAHGTVVISDATSRLVRDAFVLEALGPTALKGVAEPMSVYRVLGPAEAGEIDPMAATAPFVVGRGEEVGLLRRLWEQCKEGLGHAVLVSGTAGIGKSTVVDVLRAHVKEEGLARLVFRCSPYHRNIALYPVVTHLENLLQLGRRDPPLVKLDKLEEGLRRSGLPLEEAVPLFASLFSIPVPEESYSALDLTPVERKQRTFDALVAWLLGEAERHPVLTAWEDLHWADPSTLEVLGLVLEQAPTVPMLHVLTFRPEFELPWPRRSHMTPITLHRLERPQVEP